VRIASWVLIVCSMVAALGLFMPCLEVRLHGALLSKRTSLSLYSANKHEDLVRKLLSAYRGSSRRHVGGAMIDAAKGHVGGRLGGMLGDARDAMDTLDDISDDDVKAAGTALTVTLWTFLALSATLIALVFVETMRGAYRRSRLVAAVALAVLLAAIAVVLHIAFREVVFEANDELGGDSVQLAVAAYIIPLGALASLSSAIVLLVRRGRERLSLTPL
jgi:hypothetical protein